MIGNTNARVNSASGIGVSDSNQLMGGNSADAYTVQDYLNTVASRIKTASITSWTNSSSWGQSSPSAPYICYCRVDGLTTASQPVVGLYLGNLSDATVIKQRQKMFGMIDKAETVMHDFGDPVGEICCLKLTAYSKNPSSVSTSSPCSLLVKGY